MARTWLLFALLAGCRLHFDDRDTPADGPGPDAVTSLRVRVTGWGAITGPGGIACMDDCSYAITGPVALSAIAGEAQSLTQFCGTDDTCNVQPGADVTATFVPREILANRVFVSSATAALGASGRTGLDMQCATEAAASSLGGTWIAFVSTSTEDAVARLAGSRGWVRMDGLPLLDVRDDVGNDGLPRGVALEASGAPHPVGAGFVLTGSDVQGQRVAGQTCNDYTGGTNAWGALVDASGFALGGGTISGCTGFLYCFEIGKSVVVNTAPPSFPVGRYVFVSTSFNPASGVSGADAACQTDATANGLPGTYKALLATTSQSALEHAGPLDGAWRRPDGASVTRTGLGGGNFSTTIAQSAARQPFQGAALFGAPSLSDRATSGSCNDWMGGTVGQADVVQTFRMSPFDDTAFSACVSQSVICVQTQ